MRRMYRIIDEDENYDQKTIEDTLLEKVFKEGCEHGYKKAMQESESYNEKTPHKESLEEKLARLKKKYE